MPWATLIQLVAPYGVDLIEYVVKLIVKESQGQPVTPDDWRGLAQLHASKSLSQAVRDAAAQGK